jgi:hypothetical protein
MSVKIAKWPAPSFHSRGALKHVSRLASINWRSAVSRSLPADSVSQIAKIES